MTETYVASPPRQVQEVFDRGFAAFERGNLDHAIEMLTTAVEMEPRFLTARKFLRAAQVQRFKAHKRQAVAHALGYVKGMPLLLLGVLQLRGRKATQALATAEKLMRIDPLNLRFVFFLADAATAVELPEVAVQSLEVARDHNPRDTETLRRLGQAYIAARRSREATQCFEMLCKLLPDSLDARKWLKDASAQHSMDAGRWEEAATEGKSSREILRNADETASLEREGKQVKTAADTTRIIAETKAKIEKEPDNLNHRRALARHYVELKMFDEAVETLQEALQRSSGDPALEVLLSDVYIRIYDEHIALHERSGDTAAAAAMRAEKDDFRLQDVEDRVSRYPTDLELKYQLGVILHERGRLDEALRQFQQSLRNPKRRTDSMYRMALCFREKGQLDLARQRLEEAAAELAIFTDAKKEIVFQLAATCETMGDLEEAGRRYKEVYGVDISYKDVGAKIDKLYNRGGSATPRAS